MLVFDEYTFLQARLAEKLSEKPHHLLGKR
jgi:hypothetical protein